MAVFKELNNVERMRDPEERHAAELERSKKNFGRKIRVRDTSVSMGKYVSTMRFVGFLVKLVVLIIALYFVYIGVLSFIPEKS